MGFQEFTLGEAIQTFHPNGRIKLPTDTGKVNRSAVGKEMFATFKSSICQFKLEVIRPV
jgi:hypothetical protein